ncbi:MAG: hypothetical protein ABIH70_07150 [Chloroflexota bacterium]
MGFILIGAPVLVAMVLVVLAVWGAHEALTRLGQLLLRWRTQSFSHEKR